MWSVILLNGLMIALLYRFDLKKRGLLPARIGKRDRFRILSLYSLFLTLLYLNLRFPIPYLMFAFCVPFFTLSFFRLREQREIEKGMIGFLQALNARLLVDDDIMKAIENTTEMVAPGPIRRILREFTLTFKVSCNPVAAFDKIREVNHPYLRYIFLNIQNVLNSWGDAAELIRELENEYISVQTELNKGRAELQNDKLMTYFGLLMAGVTSFQVLSANTSMVKFYMSRPILSFLLVFLAISGIVVLATTKIGE